MFPEGTEHAIYKEWQLRGLSYFPQLVIFFTPPQTDHPKTFTELEGEFKTSTTVDMSFSSIS